MVEEVFMKKERLKLALKKVEELLQARKKVGLAIILWNSKENVSTLKSINRIVWLFGTTGLNDDCVFSGPSLFFIDCFYFTKDLSQPS